MEGQIAVYVSWFIFAIFSYMLLVYSISSLWFVRIKAKQSFYDWNLIAIETVIFALNLIGQVFTVYLFLVSGRDLITNKQSTTTEYWILIGVNFFLILVYLFFYLYFSNNLAVKFTDQKVYLVGMSVLNSAFISVEKLGNNNVVMEYVYNQEKRRKWTEKLKFYRFFASTKFILENYKKYFDPRRNLDFFNLDNVVQDTKTDKVQTTDVVASREGDGKKNDVVTSKVKVNNATLKDVDTVNSKIVVNKNKNKVKSK